TIGYTGSTLTVTAKALSVTADPVSKPYGNTYTFDTTTPSSDFGVSGLVNSDTVDSVTLSSTRAAATAPVVDHAPPYPTLITRALHDALPIYTIGYTGSTLTVTAKALSVTADPVSKPYGNTYTFDTTTPSSDFGVSGLVNSDTVDSVTLS